MLLDWCLVALPPALWSMHSLSLTSYHFPSFLGRLSVLEASSLEMNLSELSSSCVGGRCWTTNDFEGLK